jgi:hypothetical protein
MDFYPIRFFYVLLLVGFFLVSLLICALFGTLTNFIILNGLMPFLKCSSAKLDLNKFLKMPLLVYLLLFGSLILDAAIYYFNSFFGSNTTIFLYLVIFALFLAGVIIVKKNIVSACKSDFSAYLISIIFVLINYILI